MKFSFEEKKKSVCIMAVIIFVVIAGIIYFSLHYNVDNNGSDANKIMTNDEINVCESSDKSVDDDITNECDSSDDLSNEDLCVNSEQNDYSTVIVHVCGAVVSPGIYKINGDKRVADAVEAAGGFLNTADKEYINLARTVNDGEKLVIYTRKETKKLADNESNNETVSEDNITKDTAKDYVNINSASVDELMTLPGIGKSKADAIIAFREENGGFSKKEDLMQITGIKEGVYSKIKEMIIAK